MVCQLKTSEPLSSNLDLSALRLALRAVELGSVAAVARELDMLPATATAAIRRLEQQLGSALFTRNNRALRTTPEGEAFLLRARDALAMLDDGMGALRAPISEVSGLLRLSVPVDLGVQSLLPLLDEFLALYPQVQLELFMSDRLSDLGREPVDAAIRYGRPEQPGLIVRKLKDNERILVAAPAYLARKGVPVSIEDLALHDAIGLRIAGRPADLWELHEAGRVVQVRPRLRRSTDNGMAAHLWAVAGQGIAVKSRLDVLADLVSGRLCHVLPAVNAGAYPLVLALARGAHLSARVRALGDFLQARLEGR